MATQLALLRGINVGGKNSVPMKQLAALFVEAGCKNVRTYIQSGNVIFDFPAKPPDELGQSLSTAIEKQFGCHVPIVMRTLDQLRAVLENNPLFLNGQDEEMLHVYFLARRPSAEQVAQLDGARSLPDTFVVQGNEIYLRLPNGMGRSKLTNAYFDAKLGTTCTARNWRTARKLIELMSE